MLALSVAVFAHEPTAGKVKAAVGGVTATRAVNGKVEHVVLKSGETILNHDRIRTTNDGRVRIELEDHSVLTLGVVTELHMLKHDVQKRQTELQLVTGKIRCQVPKLESKESSFRISTPTAVAAVVGTDFGADASVAGQTHFICIDGTTKIYSKDMKSSVECGASRMVTVSAGKVPRAPESAAADHVEHWKHVTEPGDKEADKPAPAHHH